MGKIAASVGTMAGISLLFYFGGLLSNTASSSLLTLALDPSSLQTSGWVIAITSVFGFTLAVVSTFVARNQNSAFWLMIPFVTILLTFGWDFLVIFQMMASTSEVGGIIATLFFAPWLIVYMIGVVEWWRGIQP